MTAYLIIPGLSMIPLTKQEAKGSLKHLILCENKIKDFFKNKLEQTQIDKQTIQWPVPLRQKILS
jgi:hypothetical protein